MLDLLLEILGYLALLCLLLLSAFFSGSEIALAQANQMRLKASAENGDRRAKTALRLLDSFTELISTILVGNNLVNIAFSSVITLMAVEKWFPNGAYTPAMETLTTMALTVVILIFGEIVPKILCAEHADSVSRAVAVPLRWCAIIFAPVVKGVRFIMDRISPLWTPKEPPVTATAEELCTIVEEIEGEGVFTQKEGELIRSAIEFSEVTAREVMIPRVDVAGIDLDEMDAGALLADRERLSYGRLPVYRGSLDNVVGILSVKRFLAAMLDDPETDLESILFEPVYVHMTRTVSSILEEFLKEHRQMAIVIDEFGGTMGILTLEDIVEEIVGDIYDERDDVEQDVVQRGKSFEVDGSANIYDCFEEIGFEDDDFESEYTTVGGWATEVLDKFPEPGDRFSYKTLAVTVLEAEDHRVEKLLIETVSPADGENA